MQTKFGFNIDHIATLRNARGEGYPNLLKIAKEAITAGANQITAHLREDRRHIKDKDIFDLKEQISVDLNMEMAVTSEMTNIACKVKPHAVCLVPEKREELTTEGGLNVCKLKNNLISKIELLKSNSIKVVLFIDADIKQVEQSLRLPIDAVEFNTGRYANYFAKLEESQIVQNSYNKELDKIISMSKLVTKSRLEAHAGHGLNYSNVTNIAKIKEIKEFNIGHFLISEAVSIGLSNSIKKMLRLINSARKI